MELHALQIVGLIIAALLIGFSKTGLPSAGMFSVILMATIFPIKASVGIVLPMLITGDIVAVTVYRRQAVWKYLLILIPWVLIGIVGGYFVLDYIDNRDLELTIGILVLALILLHLGMQRYRGRIKISGTFSKWANPFLGALAGFATMIGNAAGGVMAVYLLSKKLPKEQFIGTGAWFFLAVNLLKVPFNIQLRLITLHTFLLNLWMVPVILIGTWIGIKLLKKIPEKYFQLLVLILSALGAAKLIL